ncbi:hypothetical protein Tco_0294064, partial [Tanacetum coccineum]
QRDLDKDPSNQVLHEEEAVYVKAFNDALLMEEQFLKQKDKIEWLRVGDSNLAYFHKMDKGHIHRSRIDAGVHQTLNSENLFNNKLDSNIASFMILLVSNKDIKEAIFFMGNDKSPGPDGYTAAFFKEAWDIVSSDVIKAMKEFFTNGNLLKEVNHTIITPIPKVASPTRINDYRPISYCNIIYKCISKIIASRIKDSLKNLVSPNQSAFVSGQRISDNILLTYEIIDKYGYIKNHKKTVKNGQARARESEEYKKKPKNQNRSQEKSSLHKKRRSPSLIGPIPKEECHVVERKAQVKKKIALVSLTKEAQAVTSRNDSLAILGLQHTI